MSQESGEPVANPSSVVVFAFDSAEVSQVRRIGMVMAFGYNVHVFSMRRGNQARPIATDFPNTHLFWTEHEKLWKRVFTILAAIVKMSGHYEKIRNADVILARNLDMLIIAWVARQMAGARRVPLIYECLDIHKAMTDQGWKSRLFRSAERWLLRRCEMLVVSSPGYIRSYFEPVQGYFGPSSLWENRLVPNESLPDRTLFLPVPPKKNLLRLGWVGSIRCAPSLKVLQQVARTLGSEIEIHIHGVVHEHVLPDFFEVVAAHENMTFHGRYTYPVDLHGIYQSFDLVWNVDMWIPGGNSDWCLTNRIYEAGWAGCPSLSMEGTEVGHYEASNKFGWALATDDATAVCTVLQSLNSDEIVSVSQWILDQDESVFVTDGSEIRIVLDDVIKSALTDRAEQ